MIKSKFDWIIKYFKETRAETKKVVWPDRRYVSVATVIILIISIITSIYMMLVDWGFTKLFKLLLK